MAYDLNEVPEEVRDILAHMSREMRQRVLADYETHYAPFLSMLAGWKGAVQAHYAQGENSAIARLQEQFFPLGDWKFPAQGLAAPQRPAERTSDIAFGSEFKDPAGRPWTACGDGWLHPTSLHGSSIQWINDAPLCMIHVDHMGAGRPEALLERGQLAFIAAPEEVVAAMAEAEWWVQFPGSPPRPAHLSRYDGFMAFERELATSRMNQRQLDLWLPPCHPYSRKVVRLQLPSDATAHSGDAPGLFQWLDEVRSGFRFVGVLPNPDRRARTALRAANGQLRVELNPVPVVQTAVEDCIFYPPFPRAGSDYALRLGGVPDLFAAVAYNDNATVPASMIHVPSNDPAAPGPDVQVQFAQADASVAQIKLYYGSFGQERADRSDNPTVLEMTPFRFAVPFPIIGGVTVGGAESRAEWARSAWFHSVLRPPLLTEGDLVEIIRQRKGMFGDLVRFRYATREILHDFTEGSMHWRSYLWPSVVANENNFDPRFGEIPASNYIPLIQSLRLAFERGPASAGLPDFLLADVANYLASVLSQYFVLSCFRVDGRVV